MRGLSKSRYTTFCQCEKALWLKVYKPEEEVLEFGNGVVRPIRGGDNPQL